MKIKMNLKNSGEGSMKKRFIQLGCAALFLIFASEFSINAHAQEMKLNTDIPMTAQSWADVETYVNDINTQFAPDLNIQFKMQSPYEKLSEKQSVEILDSIVSSWTSGQAFDPAVGNSIFMKCNDPRCNGK